MKRAGVFFSVPWHNQIHISQYSCGTHGHTEPNYLQNLLPCFHNRRETNHAAKKRDQASTGLRAIGGCHHALSTQHTEYFYRDFGGKHCSENIAMCIFSRCEGELAPTSATQYIFAMLYGTFCLQAWSSPLDGQSLMGQNHVSYWTYGEQSS